MEVLNEVVNEMRLLYSLLMAILAALATLSVSQPASGQTIEGSSEQKPKVGRESEGKTQQTENLPSSWIKYSGYSSVTPNTNNAPSESKSQQANLVVPTISLPESSQKLEFKVRNQNTAKSQQTTDKEQIVTVPNPILNAQTPAREERERIPRPSPVPSPQVPTTPEIPTPSSTPNPIPSPLPTTPPTPSTTPNPQTPSPQIPTPSPTPNTIPSPQTPTPESQPEPRVLVGEVLVTGVEGDLQNQVYQVIRTRPGRTATRSQLQEDVNAIYATGLFARVRVDPADTPLGVRVTFAVDPNPVLRSVTLNVVPTGETSRIANQQVIDNIFGQQYGSTLNLRTLQENIKKLNQYYKDKGYDLAQVIETPQVDPNGTVTLVVAEGLIENIQVRYLNKDTKTPTDPQGNPVRGRTREFIITRELELKSGAVFNRQTAQNDLRRVYGLGIFEDVQFSFSPGQDPRRVVVNVDVIERNSGSVAAGAGISSASGLFGTLSYQQQNLGGNNQKLGAEVQIGQRELLFDLNFTDPWIAGDPYRTSYNVNLFRRRTISLIFDGGRREVNLPNGDNPRILRYGGDLTFTRPLSKNPLEKSDWVASLGVGYQQISVRDFDGRIARRDELGNPLTFSGKGIDNLITLQFGVSRDLRNDPLRPTQGSLLRLGVEQSIPIGAGNILLNRLRGSYSYYVPVSLTNFTKGPQTLAFNIQAGTVLGDLPPYEAFSLGGSNSVRGYDEGDVGAGRRFVQATAEYRFPVFSIIGGALFVDYGTDLGSGSSVLGNPAGVRLKPGNGLGYGLGVRVQSPLGPIRIDYGINDRGNSRIHFGIGERF